MFIIHGLSVLISHDVVALENNLWQQSISIVGMLKVSLFGHPR